MSEESKTKNGTRLGHIQTDFSPAWNNTANSFEWGQSANAESSGIKTQGCPAKNLAQLLSQGKAHIPGVLLDENHISTVFLNETILLIIDWKCDHFT